MLNSGVSGSFVESVTVPLVEGLQEPFFFLIIKVRVPLAGMGKLGIVSTSKLCAPPKVRVTVGEEEVVSAPVPWLRILIEVVEKLEQLPAEREFPEERVV